jgi:hypothetical protein
MAALVSNTRRIRPRSGGWIQSVGEPLATDGTVDNDNVPDNQPGHMDYGWLGQR